MLKYLLLQRVFKVNKVPEINKINNKATSKITSTNEDEACFPTDGLIEMFILTNNYQNIDDLKTLSTIRSREDSPPKKQVDKIIQSYLTL